MAILEAKNITKFFPGVKALDDVSITVESGRIHCIIGENGAGKSTLIKILTGIYPSDEGDVFIGGERVNAWNKRDRKFFDQIAYVPQELDLFNDLSVAENLFIPYKKNGIKAPINYRELGEKARPLLSRFKITVAPEDLVRDISVSERQMLQIARSMTDSASRILMLDEPTTSLTTTEAERLFDVLKELKAQGKAIIFISHKLEEVFTTGDDITVLRNGKKVADAGVKDVSIPWVISRMVGTDVVQQESYKSERVSDEILLEARDLCGEKFSHIDFTLRRGEILGFSGLVGSGRTEIMQALFGYLPLWSGEVFIRGKKREGGSTSRSVRDGFIYMPEERKQQGILPGLSIKVNATVPLLDKITRSMVISPKKETEITRRIIEAYDIKASSQEQHIEFLSGGNQQKVIIGRAMFAGPRILVFDEPTKGIDIGSKIEIYRLMKKLAEDEQIGVILISSEMNEVIKCANRIITMYFGRKIGESTAPFDRTVIMDEIMGIAAKSGGTTEEAT